MRPRRVPRRAAVGLPDDIYASAAYRRALVGTLVERALLRVGLVGPAPMQVHFSRSTDRKWPSMCPRA